MVDQLLLQPVSAPRPVLLQVLCKVASNDHAAAIRHETCLIHISHQCVNQRHACPAFAPPLDNLCVRLPIVVLTVVDAILTEHLVSVVHAPETIEITPKKLVNENFC